MLDASFLCRVLCVACARQALRLYCCWMQAAGGAGFFNDGFKAHQTFADELIFLAQVAHFGAQNLYAIGDADNGAKGRLGIFQGAHRASPNRYADNAR